MNDQAAGLRALQTPGRSDSVAIAAERFPSLYRFSCPFLVVTGGKGGVGKSSVAANLAFAISNLKKRVLLVDLDLGLANLDILFRLFPKKNLEWVAKEKASATECLVAVKKGLDLLPASSGIAEMAATQNAERERMLAQLAELSTKYDYVIADTAAGIAPDVLHFAQAASQVLVVSHPEPAALTDAYALLKLLFQKRRDLRAAVILNYVASSEQANESFKKLQFAVHRFCAGKLEDLGWLPRDSAVMRAHQEQSPFVHASPDSLAAGAIRQLAQRIIS